MSTLIRVKAASPSVLSALADRRVIMALAAAGVAAGLALNWTWLTAVGVAPLLLSVLPCAAMCALGLCMSRMTGRSCRAGADAEQASASTKDEASARAAARSPQTLSERSIGMSKGRSVATSDT